MRKRDRHCHVHAINGDRDRDEMPGTPLPPLISRPAALRLMAEVVYAVRLGDGLIKIGWTRNLAARLYKFGPGAQLLAIKPGGTYADEQKIHASLIDHLHHGKEWYHPTPGVMKVVNDMRATIGLEPAA